VREPVIELGALGDIGHAFDSESNFGQRHRTDVEQFERLGGNECDHLGLGLRTAQLG